MPIFEYICNECNRAFEKIVARHDSTTDCPHCSSRDIEKQLSVFAVSGSQSESMPDAGCGRCGSAQPGVCGMNN